jgi:phosphoribosyl 1,2-cyclic phosphodiesterase
MLGFCPLASGSKGNSIYVGTPKAKILIDAGLSGKVTKARLAEIGVELSEIEAILVTHEHADHITGLRSLAYQMGIPVFANKGTARGIVNTFKDTPTFKLFTTGETFCFKDLEIHPFSIQHDTIDPVAFTLSCEGLKMGFCTDLGFATTLVRNRLQECDYLYLEANHKPEMVHASSRPHSLKQRILSRSGHLSNEECGELLVHVASPRLKHVHLAHLSSECNTPETALSTVRDFLAKIPHQPELSVAPQESLGRAIRF